MQRLQLTSVIVRTVEVVDVEVLGHCFDVLRLLLLLLLVLAVELFCANHFSVPCRVLMHGCILCARGSMGGFNRHVLVLWCPRTHRLICHGSHGQLVGSGGGGTGADVQRIGSASHSWKSPAHKHMHCFNK